MIEYSIPQQLDVRELDNLFLETIGGDDYYEVRQIVRRRNGVRSVIGRASDWPMIRVCAQLADRTALLAASERRSVEADCHVSELLTRCEAYRDELHSATSQIVNLKDHIAALEAALAEAPIAPPPEIPPSDAEQAEAAFQASIALLEGPDDGKVPCDHPGCTDRVKPQGLGAHKRIQHGAPKPERRKCPHCSDRPTMNGMQAHIERKHPEQITVVAAPPPPPPIEVALGEAPWSCASCHTNTHAKSIANPLLCKRCVIELTDHVLSNGNGHHVVA